MLYLITGGVRSGKSSYAEGLVKELGEQTVLYIATLAPGDDEMRRRIKRHRSRRPAAWRTVEAPLGVGEAIAAADETVVLLDCLSGLVTNLVLKHEADGEELAVSRVIGAVNELLETVAASAKTVIVVTNEVGAGVVPPYPLGRWYRDALGLANQRVARAAGAVALVTVGLPQVLKGTFPALDFSEADEVNGDI